MDRFSIFDFGSLLCCNELDEDENARPLLLTCELKLCVILFEPLIVLFLFLVIFNFSKAEGNCVEVLVKGVFE